MEPVVNPSIWSFSRPASWMARRAVSTASAPSGRVERRSIALIAYPAIATLPRAAKECRLTS